MAHPPGDESTQLLKRIAAAVEPRKPRRGFELICAILLSLATTGSAWCAYQSKLWGGVQFVQAGQALQASSQSARTSLAVLESRSFDAAMFITFMEAKLSGNARVEEFLMQRFRPKMQSAVTSWFSLNPLENPSAPSSPLQLEQYQAAELSQIARHDEVAAAAMAASRQARQNSDDYVLLTVLFATVLFFAGIARAFEAPRLRLLLAGVAVTLFLVTFCLLVTMPLGRS